MDSAHQIPPPQPPEVRRPPLWTAILFLALPFVPVALAVFAYRSGLSHGCLPGGTDPCIVMGFDIAEVILRAMAVAWLTIFGVLGPAILSTWVSHRAVEGFGPRLAIGGIIPAGVIVGTVVAPTALVEAIKPPGCTLAELGSACRLFGAGMEQAFALAAAAPWPIALAAIPAAIYVVIYAIILGIDAMAELSRQRVAARVHEQAIRQGLASPGTPAATPAHRQKSPPRPRKPLVYIPKKRV